MEKRILFDLEQNRKRLEYYFQLKQKSGSSAPDSLNKWIEIYSERMEKLENQAKKLKVEQQSA